MALALLSCLCPPLHRYMTPILHFCTRLLHVPPLCPPSGPPALEDPGARVPEQDRGNLGYCQDPGPSCEVGSPPGWNGVGVQPLPSPAPLRLPPVRVLNYDIFPN